MMGLNLNIVILAAGQGKRMYSDLPKVLHPLAGYPLLYYVIQVAKQLHPQNIYVVYGHKGDQVRLAFADESAITWVEQVEQRGTAHAVQQTLPYLSDDSTTLILSGDVPLLTLATLEKLYQAVSDKSAALLVATVNEPAGLGRIIRDKNNLVTEIVEEKDATASQKSIKEIYSGVMAIKTKQLRKWLAEVDDNNAQKEFYLTAIPALALAQGHDVTTISALSELEILGINTKNQLALLERSLQKQRADELMQQGVTLLDPTRFDLRGTVSVGKDVCIDINVILEGQVKLGHRVKIGAHSILRNVTIGDDVVIKPYSILEDSVIAQDCVIGPFSRLRPETELAAGVHIGNFVEVKKSYIDSGSKVNHLTYIGDANIGKRVNVGAGTITCNYDGVNKHKTQIEDDVFIGSNTSLIAPIHIGEFATIAAGSTINKDAPSKGLTIARSKQLTLSNWKRPEKIK